MTRKLLACGCSANCTVDGVPGCVTHGCTTPATEEPDLSQRQARCAYGDSIVPSDYNLAFFKYRGPGSFDAINKCKCGYYRVAHNNSPTPSWSKRCQNFEAHGPYEYDEYYCGCHGWD